MKHTQQWWQQNEPLYQKILKHPFNQQLASGTLASVTFTYYLQQDALYLADFARALSLLSAKAVEPVQTLAFARFAEGAIVVEQALHQQFFKQFGAVPATEKKPTCFAYTNWLLSTCALAPVAVGAAAVLPCFWIYEEVGKALLTQAASPNPYQSWLNTYAGDEFGQLVAQMLQITDTLAEQATPAVQVGMALLERCIY